MHLDWIGSPLALYGLLFVGLNACLVLFLTLKFELHAAREGAERSGSELTERVQVAENAVAQLREAVEQGSARAVTQSPALNLTRRTQAVRMHRRGEPVETIAAALGAPRNEIQLLIKLQEMTEQRS